MIALIPLLLAGVTMSDGPTLTEIARHDRAYSAPTWRSLDMRWSADGVLYMSPWKLDTGTGRWERYEPARPPDPDRERLGRTGFELRAAERIPGTQRWVLSRAYRPPRRGSRTLPIEDGVRERTSVVDSSGKRILELATGLAPSELAASKEWIAASAGSVRVWPAGKTEPSTLEVSAAGVLGFSADGRLLAAKRHGGVTVFRSSGWTVSAELAGHGEHDVGALAFSPDGRLLATGDPFDQLCLWRMPAGEKVSCRSVEGARGIAFSPDGKRLAVATAAGTGTLLIVEVGP